jgi:hypothetical protein
MAIIELVARAEGTDPAALNPLYHTIDPDRLDSICDPVTGFRELSFVYEGRTVSVAAVDDTVEISLDNAATGTTARLVGDVDVQQ